VNVSGAVAARRSVRAFTDEPVPRAVLEDLLARAVRAPSGGNLQPWKVIALAGEARDAACQAGLAAITANPGGEDDEAPVYPKGLIEPYRSRRHKVGEDMYALLGIPREDKAARMGWLASNFSFFGAPVGLFLVVDRAMGRGQWAHMGMFMQTLALLATEAGYGTCMQEAWAMVRRTMHAHLKLPESDMLYCGMALGRPDEAAAVNRLRTERAGVDEFAELRGF
jgi:nitroreductase